MGALPVVALVGLGLGGLVVGSFLNTVIVRLPEGETLLRPGPRCPECQAPLAPQDLVPVMSWLVLRARCRRCSEPIAAGYPLVELANAALWVLAGLRFGTSWALVPMLVLFSTLLAQSVIDLELYRLLDRITFPVLGVSIVLVAAASALEGDPSRVGMALVGGLAYSLFLYVPSWFSRGRAMGLGDVKLGLLMGLYLGWLHPLLILYAIMIGCVAGLVVGGVLLVVRRSNDHYPFGPWLALGCIVALLAPGPVLDPYTYVLPAWLG